MIIFHKRKWRKEREQVMVFLKLQVDFWSGVLGMFLGWSDILKKAVVKLMYRQRGRFSQSFVNISMAGMAFLAIVFSGKVEELLATDKRNELGGGSYLLMDANGVGGVNTLISDLPKGEITEYRVMEGDTVSSIAAKFGVSIDTIIWENDLKSVDSIKPKQILRILPEVGIRHAVKRGETVYSVAKKYQSDAQAIIDYPFNTFTDDEAFSLMAGQELFIPDGIKPKQIVIGTRYIAKTVAPIPGVQGEGNFMWPTSGTISQRYRWYHRAVDIASRSSPDVLASQGGTVVAAGWSGGYGNMVTIDHGNGYKTVYAHMKTGTQVREWRKDRNWG